ncbi:nuclear pore complex protein Nup133 [Leptinotarsa decemlineata]|uniref:nuclear pore complex protein Nup133 n=1 Tax=Leptinotarsa decemlineata TaxID=7539 RepID=UPI000C2534A0|nr:nuclear pore complex protein Nup133 [Leptinotarsa decemlineata]
MEKSFQSSFSVKSPFSPRSRQSIGSKRILPNSFRKSSRLSVSGKSTQSVQIVLKSNHYYVERFGQSLPVLITEALTFADRNTVVSARISECGFAWVVCGRRLLIWQYRQSTSGAGTPQRKHGNINQCFELQLPQSDLAHRAELVTVFITAGCNNPSCIAVSPEGVLRYWPAVAHEGVTVEQTVDLQGQECDSLTNVEGLGCILATTTCSVVLVQPQVNNCRHSLICKPLKTPSGWLGGISKRMSSLIFGPNSNEQSSETRLVRVLSIPNKDSTWTIYVLAGHSLQKWILSNHDNEQLVSITELNRMVRDQFHSAVWESCVGDQAEIDTWLLDIQSDKDNIIILAAAVNMQMSPQVHYAMISFSTNGSTQIKDFLILKMSGLYREDNPSESLSYRFLLCGTSAYVYNLKTITVLKPQEEPDILEFNSSQDFLLGGSICVNTPVFFSRLNGLVAVCGNDQICDFLNQTAGSGTPIETSFNESVAVNNLSVYNIDPDEIFNAHKDTIGQMKAAFIFHIRNQQSAYQEILNELFPLEATLPNINGPLDKLAFLCCKDLLDDIPAGDPRWNKVATVGLGSSYSMQVLHQLEDKQKAFSLYLRFLKESGLWNRLSACIIRECPMPTVQALGELSEKITAAVVMKSLPNSLIMEEALEKSIAYFQTEPGNGLTNQDVFYREVSKVQRGIQELVNCCEDSAHSDLNPAQIAQVVNDTNEIVLTVLNEVIQYRTQNAENFVPSETAKSLNLEYLPWTGASGSEGVADALLQQHSSTFNYGLKLVSQGQLRNSLLDHFVALTDLLMDGKKGHLESIKNRQRESIAYKQYCTDRHNLIKPLLSEKEYERAALLAEKYLDFETLVLICELTDNQTRLDEYMGRFNDSGFSEYVYNWYLKQNKQGKLIDRCRKSGTARNNQKLSDFLSDHPSLSWLQQIFDGKYPTAADTLRNLANNENESLTRQRTMLSLSKLAKLAGPNTNDINEYIENVNNSLDLVAFQEDLPDYVLQQFGYDVSQPPVIPPKDLINLYICKEYTDAGDLEFKKALDILTYIDNRELQEDLRLKIWRSAILRDSWNYKNLDSPLEILQGTLFFKLIDLSLVLGADPQTLLPPLDTLTESETLHHLQEKNNFQFLIKTAYEHVYRSQVIE